MAGGGDGRWAEGLGCDAVNLVAARVGVSDAWSSVSLLCVPLRHGCLYFRVWVKPLFFNASWYSSMCELNKLSDEDMDASLLFTEIGTFFITCGGWFEYLLIYRGMLFGFL